MQWAQGQGPGWANADRSRPCACPRTREAATARRELGLRLGGPSRSASTGEQDARPAHGEAAGVQSGPQPPGGRGCRGSCPSPGPMPARRADPGPGPAAPPARPRPLRTRRGSAGSKGVPPALQPTRPRWEKRPQPAPRLPSPAWCPTAPGARPGAAGSLPRRRAHHGPGPAEPPAPVCPGAGAAALRRKRKHVNGHQGHTAQNRGGP